MPSVPMILVRSSGIVLPRRVEDRWLASRALVGPLRRPPRFDGFPDVFHHERRGGEVAVAQIQQPEAADLDRVDARDDDPVRPRRLKRLPERRLEQHLSGRRVVSGQLARRVLDGVGLRP
jgi:hypothetical protein